MNNIIHTQTDTPTHHSMNIILSVLHNRSFACLYQSIILLFFNTTHLNIFLSWIHYYMAVLCSGIISVKPYISVPDLSY